MKYSFQKTVILLATVLLFGCPNETNSSPSERTAYQANESDLSSLRTEIKELIADKSCSQSSDCKLIALGAKPCGGPDSYEVYSSVNTDEKKLSKLAKKLESLHKEYNKKNQIMGICMMEPEPSFSCKNSQCTKSGASNLVL